MTADGSNSVNRPDGHRDDRPRIVVAICTFHRNEALSHLLTILSRIANDSKDAFCLGVAVVDDSADQQARVVADAFKELFELGTLYAHSGARNISLARNAALELALDTTADWIAMTDDDCEPSQQWLRELLRVQHRFRADVVTGPLFRRAPDHAPHWLRTQPFLNVTAFRADTGTTLDVAFTNNSMIRADLLRQNPDLRFDPSFGRIGGEDVVFYRSVAKRGFSIVFAAEAEVYENEDESRLSLSYQLRRHFWLGNSSARTSIEQGATAPRMLLHGIATLARALHRPVDRILNRKSPQILYLLAQLLEGIGKVSGAIGFKVNHK